MNMDERVSINQVAALLDAADYLLIAAGAGFSADSGLPVYQDIANVPAYERMGFNYQDLCDPEYFYRHAPAYDLAFGLGFWGKCLATYRRARPHAGYDILARWQREMKTRDDVFFIYTSNVDGHFRRCRFPPSCVYELHGNLETWQCAGKSRSSGPCSSETWSVPEAFTKWNIPIDDTSREAYDFDHLDYLTCSRCQGHARPNVLMFRDHHWIPHREAESRYVQWEAKMEQTLASDTEAKLVVLEIGCGRNVPSVRQEMAMVVHDTKVRCADPQTQVAYVRINVEDPVASLDRSASDNTPMLLQSTALDALTAIDAIRSRRSSNVS